MFSKTTDAMRSIATKLTTATDYARKALTMGSNFVKTGLLGYIHMVSDAFSAAIEGYERAIRADTVRGSIKAGLDGFINNMAAGIQIGAATEVATDMAGAARTRSLGGRAFTALAGRALLLLSIGYVYERLRDVSTDDIEEQMEVIYLNDEGDIIDAEATEAATAD